MNASPSQSLVEFREVVDAHQAKCSDWNIESKASTFKAPWGLEASAEASGLFAGSNVRIDGSLNDHAFNQLQSRLDGPGVRWLGNDAKCPADLRATIMNALIEARDNMRFLLRQKDDAFRAVLSDQYTPFDHHQLVGLVADAVEQMPSEFVNSAKVHRAEVGDELRAWVLFPAITFGPDPRGQNGGLHPAIYLRNSEIGTASVRVHGGTFRAFCSNGTIYGWETGEAFRISHRFLSVNTMRLTIADAVVAALKMSEKAAQKFIDAQEVHLVPSKVNDLINEWAGKYGIEIDSKETWSSMVKGESLSLGRANDPRLFDVINGLTFAAQSRGEDERELMERMAGDLLAIPVGERYIAGRG